jgi:hypothetical protein
LRCWIVFIRSISQEGKWANQKLKKYKAENKYRKATGQAPIKEVMGLNCFPNELSNHFSAWFFVINIGQHLP